jgi:glycerol-3-phosphate dehydrogenase (NAD(P)+)
MYLIETTDDIIGVELGAALKNAYAIAVGVATGMEEQSGLPYQNFKAAMIQEATAELATISALCGGRAETIYGLAGFGDLSVTVSAGRNRLLGELLGRGVGISEALNTITSTQMTIEGYAACDLGFRMLAHSGADPTDFPLLSALHRILYDNAPVFDSLWIALRYR